jgi:hypothetical protein
VAHKAQAVSWIADAFPVGVKTDGLSGTPIQVEFYLRFGPRKSPLHKWMRSGLFLDTNFERYDCDGSCDARERRNIAPKHVRPAPSR